MRRLPRLLSMLVLAPLLSVQAADEVTIYRCTDANGHLTVRDTPCNKNQTQQARSMLRPKDAAAPVRTGQAPPPRIDVETPPPRVVVVNAPRPVYDCVTPDGHRYTSDTPEGNPRWVPLWTLGLPMSPLPYPGTRSDMSLAITHGNVQISGGRTTVTPPVYGVAAWGAGTWVRDDCHPLPQPEVCARLTDRRDEIRRRFFNAQPNERDVLRVEERGINARLDSDCGNY